MKKQKYNILFLEEKEYFNEINFLKDKMNIFQTQEWYSFLKNTVDGVPVFIKISDQIFDYYIYGFVFKKMGINIFASPFEQWTTSYIGFLSDNKDLDYKGLIDALFSYLRKKYKILYMQIADLSIDKDYLKKHHMHYEVFKTQIINFNIPEEELFSRLEKNLRKKIRNYTNHGFKIKKVKPSKEFAKNYYLQLIDVFDLQGMKPFYDENKVVQLMASFETSDNILCLESYDANNTLLGSSISFGLNDKCITWGSASFTKTKNSRMNHPIRWESMHYWREKGALFYDMGGYNPYKDIFCPEIKEVYKVYKSVIPGMHFMKLTIKSIIALFRRRK